MKHLLLNFSLLLLLNIVMAVLSHDVSNEQILNDPLQGLNFTFDCTNKPFGFYADIEHNCTIFHLCNENDEGRPVACPSGTIFDQRLSMCSDEEDIPCQQSEQWYYLDNSNYYTYFMEPKKEAKVILEDIDVYTVKPLEDDDDDDD